MFLTLDKKILEIIAGLQIKFEVTPLEVRLQHCSQSQQSITDNEIQRLQKKKISIISLWTWKRGNDFPHFP